MKTIKNPMVSIGFLSYIGGFFSLENGYKSKEKRG